MKVCPFCKEDIKDDAIKCRYCQSMLVALSAAAPAPAPAEDSGSSSGRVTYILDRDLVRFGKFAGAVLSVMVVVGLILFGVDLKSMQESMRKSQEEMNKSLQESKKYSEEAKAVHEQVVQMTPRIEQALADIEANRVKAREVVTSIIAMSITRSVSRNEGKPSSSGSLQAHNYHVYTKAEVQALVARDVARARQYFQSLGFQAPAFPYKIDADPNYLNTYWDGKQLVFGMGMVNSEEFGPYDSRLVYHEACHSLYQISFQGQSGSVSESICDVLAVALAGEDWSIGFVKTGDPGKPAHLRSLQSPGSAYNNPKIGKDPEGSHMNEYNNTQEDNSGVHINLGIVNKAAYLMSEGGTFHGVTVAQGMGREKLAKLYAAATKKLVQGSTVNFSQWRALLVSEAKNDFGADSEEVKTVRDAFGAVGIS